MSGRRCFYLSYVGPPPPGVDDGFLGACVVYAADPEAAVQRAASLGLEPGGSAEVLAGDITGMEPPAAFIERKELLTEDDLRHLDSLLPGGEGRITQGSVENFREWGDNPPDEAVS